MIRFLPLILWLGLLVFSLLDIAQTSDDRVRGLRRFGWALVVVLLPFVGAVAWLAFGRPARSRGSAGSRRGRLGPDDDPEFLEDLRRRIARGDSDGGPPPA